MNEEEIIRLTKSLANKYNYKIDIPICINKSLSTTLGRVVFQKKGKIYSPVKIEYSPNIFVLDQEVIQNVIKHELCHYFVLIDTKQNHNHDQVWMSYARRVGCSTKATIKLENSLSKEAYKYEIRCSKCGKALKKYKRKSKVLKYPLRYKSTCCNANISIHEI